MELVKKKQLTLVILLELRGLLKSCLLLLLLRQRWLAHNLWLYRSLQRCLEVLKLGWLLLGKWLELLGRQGRGRLKDQLLLQITRQLIHHVLVMQLLLVLQELLLVQVSHRRGLHLELLYTLQDLNTVEPDIDSEVGLQIRIIDMVQERSIDAQVTFI